MSEQPIRLPISKWRRGKGVIKLLQRSGTSSDNQGPKGRAARWYPARALTNKYGKHGLARVIARGKF